MNADVLHSGWEFVERGWWTHHVLGGVVYGKGRWECYPLDLPDSKPAHKAKNMSGAMRWIEDRYSQNASLSIPGGEPGYAPVDCSEQLVACEGCWTHSIPIEELDGESCPLCGQPTMLFEQQDDFDPAVWGEGHNLHYSPSAVNHQQEEAT